MDLINDPETMERFRRTNRPAITRAVAETLAKEIGAFRYHETSALHRIGVDELFEDCVQSLIDGSAVSAHKLRNGQTTKFCLLL